MIICTIPYGSEAVCIYMEYHDDRKIICLGRRAFEGHCPNRKIVEDAPEEDAEAAGTVG